MSLRHHLGPNRPVRSGRGERGAALVEMAIISLLLLLLIAGGYDFGQAWRQGLITNEAARTGARTGSALGDNYLADWYALSGSRAALQNSGRLDDVERVVIYRADTTDGQVPSQCIDQNSTSRRCNILTGDQFRAMQISDFNTTTGCFQPALVKNWCPSSRDNVQLTADYYGVWIQTRYSYEFSILGSGTTVRRDAVMRLEPKVS